MDKGLSGKGGDLVLRKTPIQETMINPEQGFTRARVDEVNIYSCYTPPSASMEEFTNQLDRLVSDVRSRSPLVIAGDFNAWALNGDGTNERAGVVGGLLHIGSGVG